MRDHARDTRRPSKLMRRNWFETAHVHVRPLTPHSLITHERRTYHVHSTDIHWLSRNVSAWTWSVRGRASNFREILHRICSYASMCAICQWFVSECKWYVRGSCVIRAWFVSDFCPRHPKDLANFSTHKHAQFQSVRDKWVIRAWSAVWLALMKDCKILWNLIHVF